MTHNTEAILATHALSRTFTQGATSITVLNNITQSFKQGVTYAIMGISGTGKSTLLHLLAGIDMPTAGTVTFNGRDINSLNEQERQHLFSTSFGLVFQQPYLIKELSVIENIMLPGIIAGKSPDECRKEAYSLMQVTGIEHKAHATPASLSGGQQQRVTLARAALNKPKFLLADELTGHLDAATSAATIDVLLAYRTEFRMGVIVATHDSKVAQRMDIVLQLHDGVLIDISSTLKS